MISVLQFPVCSSIRSSSKKILFAGEFFYQRVSCIFDLAASVYNGMLAWLVSTGIFSYLGGAVARSAQRKTEANDRFPLVTTSGRGR